MGNREERKRERGHAGGGKGRLVNIYQLLSAYCLDFYFSGDASRVIFFPFLSAIFCLLPSYLCILTECASIIRWLISLCSITLPSLSKTFITFIRVISHIVNLFIFH